MRLFELSRGATLEDVAWLRKAVRRELKSLRIQPDLINDLQLAVAELATNAIVHGRPAPTLCAIAVDLVDASLRIEISDDGGPFTDFEAKWKQAATKDVVASDTSGLGLALAHASLRNVSYTPGGDGVLNRLVGWRPLQRQRPTILIVDDDVILLRLYGLMLRGTYRILSASTAEAALAIARSTTVDLIISDYHLGEQVGTQLLSELERDAERLPVPVIMLSSNPNVASHVSAGNFDIELFRTKPITASDLRAAVEETLIRSRRRLAGLFRYFAASVERLVAHPSELRLEQLGFACRSATATAGGGDFVLHMTAPGRDRIILADVMGHGLKAKAGAIAFSAIVRAVNAMVPAAEGPGTFLAMLSGILKRDAELCEVFATLLVVDRLHDGVLEIASAAHPAPVLINIAGARQIGSAGPLIGVFDSAEYPVERVMLGEGERIVLVTDGIETQFLAGGGSLPQGLVDCLVQNLGLPLASAADAAAAWAWTTHGPSPRDDWTIILLERQP